MWTKLKKNLIPYLFALLAVGVLVWIAVSLWNREAPRPPVDVIKSEPAPSEVRDRTKRDSLNAIKL